MILITSSLMSIPSVISITGSLKDSQGNPISGNFATEIKFYATETGTTVLDTVITTAQVTSGVFNITFTPPDSIMMVDDIWYSLAIDSNSNGLDSSDLFANRFRITSVPYSLSTPPLNYFNTFGGIAHGVEIYLMPDGYPCEDMCVVPFVSPPGGVEFNKMSILVYGYETVYFSFGIYDENGYLLYYSGKHLLQQSKGYLNVNVTGKLLPSKKYYVGFGYYADDPNDSLNIGFATQGPSAPNWGWLHNVVGFGVIPSWFNPALTEIDFSRGCIQLNITLIKD